MEMEHLWTMTEVLALLVTDNSNELAVSSLLAWLRYTFTWNRKSGLSTRGAHCP